jgi:hypothetical protein
MAEALSAINFMFVSVYRHHHAATVQHEILSMDQIVTNLQPAVLRSLREDLGAGRPSASP